MRSVVVGVYFAGAGLDCVLHAAKQVAEITHAHPLGIQGAQVIALAAALATEEPSAVYAGLAQATQWDDAISDRLPRHDRASELLDEWDCLDELVDEEVWSQELVV